MRFTAVLIGALLVLALAATGSSALPTPAPPRDCNFMTVKGKRYNIKSDVRCRRARKVARSLLTGGGARGFKCRSNPTAEIRFYCTKGNALLYVIKR